MEGVLDLKKKEELEPYKIEARYVNQTNISRRLCIINKVRLKSPRSKTFNVS